jgi:hypothetical protein
MNNNPPTTRRKETIVISVYIHDDLSGYDRGTLYKNYFAWFKTELSEISGRGVLILFPKSPPGVTDYEYQNENEGRSLDLWADIIDNEVIKKAATHSSYDAEIDKYLLLTRHDINSNFAGVSYPGGRIGIASISSYRIPAHEIGHMFNATHEDSTVTYNGWWNDSIMSIDAVGSVFRGNNYHFSEKNRENIRNYLLPID